MESRFDGHLIDRLMSAGHDVEVLPDAYSDTMGHAGAVVIHPDGTLEGAHDPRADGGAAGFSCCNFRTGTLRRCRIACAPRATGRSSVLQNP